VIKKGLWKYDGMIKKGYKAGKHSYFHQLNDRKLMVAFDSA
jgi:hypothetical protein